VNVQKSESKGWTNLLGTIALENANAKSHITFIERPSRHWWDSLTMTTAEGYSYNPDGWSFTGSTAWVPPGFRYKEHGPWTFNLNFNVATDTTVHKVDTPCGTLDYDNPESDLIFPTNLSDSDFFSIGEEMQFPNGALTITKIGENEFDEFDVHYKFTNKNKGYETEYRIYTTIIGSDGEAHSSHFYIDAGPSQTINGIKTLNFTSLGRKLILYMEDQYWVVNLD
jgi:hypothetical protein